MLVNLIPAGQGPIMSKHSHRLLVSQFLPMAGGCPVKGSANSGGRRNDGGFGVKQ